MGDPGAVACIIRDGAPIAVEPGLQARAVRCNTSRSCKPDLIFTSSRGATCAMMLLPISADPADIECAAFAERVAYMAATFKTSALLLPPHLAATPLVLEICASRTVSGFPMPVRAPTVSWLPPWQDPALVALKLAETLMATSDCSAAPAAGSEGAPAMTAFATQRLEEVSDSAVVGGSIAAAAAGACCGSKSVGTVARSISVAVAMAASESGSLAALAAQACSGGRQQLLALCNGDEELAAGLHALFA